MTPRLLFSLLQTSCALPHSQVEQASLSSNHASALARCSESEARCAALEAEAKVWAREREESLARAEALRRDHERMTALQQRQEAELEELLDKQSQLRSNNRSLEAQHRELESRYQQPPHSLIGLLFHRENHASFLRWRLYSCVGSWGSQAVVQPVFIPSAFTTFHALSAGNRQIPSLVTLFSSFSIRYTITPAENCIRFFSFCSREFILQNQINK